MKSPGRRCAVRHGRRLGAALLVAATTLTSLASADPVPNGSFETPKSSDAEKPESWEGSTWGDIVANFTYESGAASEGTHFLRIEVTDPGKEGDAKWLSVPFKPDDGTSNYHISDHYRSDVPTSLVVLFSDGAQQQEWLEVAYCEDSEDWTTAGADVEVPSWVKVIQVGHLIKSEGFLEIDDVQAARTGVGGPDARPPVSITFDDGWISGYDLLIKKMLKMGIRGTHFIITQFMDSPKYQYDYIGRAQVKEMLRAGHEIGSHTLLHEDMALMAPDYLDQNVVQSKDTLSELGANIVGLAPPFGSYDSHVSDRVVMQDRFQYLRTVKEGINVKPFKIRELWGVVVDYKMSVEDVKAWVEEARRLGGWLVLIFHRAADDPPNDAFVTPKFFQEMLDYLVTANVDLVPMGEAMGIWHPTPIPPEPEIVYPPDHSDQEPIPSFASQKVEVSTCAARPAVVTDGWPAWIGFGALGLAVARRSRLRRAPRRKR